MGERLLCKQEVIGSIPFTSTIVGTIAGTMAGAVRRVGTCAALELPGGGPGKFGPRLVGCPACRFVEDFGEFFELGSWQAMCVSRRGSRLERDQRRRSCFCDQPDAVTVLVVWHCG